MSECLQLLFVLLLLVGPQKMNIDSSRYIAGATTSVIEVYMSVSGCWIVENLRIISTVLLWVGVAFLVFFCVGREKSSRQQCAV